MFDRFTHRLRKVVVLAQEEAHHYNHNYIGTEHLLLGLLREDSKALDITLDEVREQVESIVGYGEEGTGGQAPFTPRSKKVLELALRERIPHHSCVDTEHLILALTKEHRGVAAQILRVLPPPRVSGRPLSWLRDRLLRWRRHIRMRRYMRHWRREQAQRQAKVTTLSEFLEKKQAQKREAYEARLAEQHQHAN